MQRLCADLIAKEQPSMVFFGATVIGKDLAPKVAARVNAGLAADCVDIRLDGDKFVVKRPMYSGKVMLKLLFRTPTYALPLSAPMCWWLLLLMLHEG